MIIRYKIPLIQLFQCQIKLKKKSGLKMFMYVSKFKNVNDLK